MWKTVLPEYKCPTAGAGDCATDNVGPVLSIWLRTKG